MEPSKFKANPTNEVNNPQGGRNLPGSWPIGGTGQASIDSFKPPVGPFLGGTPATFTSRLALACANCNHLPRSAYYRILLPNLLPEVDRVLYLDYDTLVLGDLTTLWHSDLARTRTITLIQGSC